MAFLRQFFVLYSSAALVSLILVGCTTEIDAGGVDFACESDADCVEGYACLAGPGEAKTCQIPGQEQGEDAGSDVGGDADFDADFDTGPDASGECAPDTEEACDCPELPIEVEGARSCTDDETWGPCICPEVCEDAVEGLVVEGTACGLCGVGSYLCADGVAECDDPAPINNCGGCQAPSSVPICSEEDGERLVCGTDETTSCVVVDEVSLQFEDFEEPDDLEVFYLFVQDADGDQGCPGGWEIAAARRPPAYRRAQADGSTYTVALPVTIDSPGALRLVIKQPMELDSLESGETESMATHFDCLTIEAPVETTIVAEPYVHPNLMRGAYRLEFSPILRMPMSTGGGSGEPYYEGNPETFWGPLRENWVRPLTYNFLSSPGDLFVGCQEDEDHQCPYGEVESLLSHYQTSRARPGVPTPSSWSQFNDDFEAFLDELTRQPLRQAYRALFDIYEQELADHLVSYDIHRQQNFDGDGHFRELIDHHPQGQINIKYPLQEYGQSAVDREVVAVRLGMTDAPLRGDCEVGQPNCYQPFAMVESEPGQVLLRDLNVTDTLEFEPFGSMRLELPANELFRYLYLDYLPNHIFPRIEEEELESGGIATHRADWDSFAQLFRSVAPCEEVVGQLEEQGVDAQLAQQFMPLCDQLYGDPQGDSILQFMVDHIPLDKEDHIPLVFNPRESCVTKYDFDPIQGLRLNEIVGLFLFDTGACHDPQPRLDNGIDYGPGFGTGEPIQALRMFLRTGF